MRVSLISVLALGTMLSLASITPALVQADAATDVIRQQNPQGFVGYARTQPRWDGPSTTTVSGLACTGTTSTTRGYGGGSRDTTTVILCQPPQP